MCGGLRRFVSSKEEIYAFRNSLKTSHNLFAQHSASGEAAVVDSEWATVPTSWHLEYFGTGGGSVCHSVKFPLGRSTMQRELMLLCSQ